MGISRYSSHRTRGSLRSSLCAHTIIWMLVTSFVLPPSLLAQHLQSQPAVPGGLQQQPGPGVSGGLLTPGGFAIPGTGGQLGQAIVTNPTALQPIVPNQVPCPIPLASDLSTKGTVPNLNDYWPVEPSSLLPSSIEQRMKQEQEERDRRQEKLQAEKEKSSIEYQVQVEREKKGVAQLPFGQGAVLGLQPSLSQTPPQPVTPPAGQPGVGRPLPEKKVFTAELLRQQDFNVEEAFAEFSVLHGVKSRVRQFGYEFFE
ncbi:MAG: hypothetical protein GDA68_17505, partial [Nitrospira sp. CR2.1]|nr:hypothetical protein [Nitrospira sp. CR2.1]